MNEKQIGRSGVDPWAGQAGGFSHRARRILPRVDVSKTLIEEACTQIKGNMANNPFKFQVIQDCRLPCEDNSMDLLVAFSVVTHIDLEDTFSYLVEALRILRPGGRMVVSYLSADVQDHWDIFLNEGQIPYEHRSQQVRNRVFMPGML
ncbi:MAG: class I SAM-dependent methyltransferase, partial [Candidatus Omnitrophica bacterium]|nr:class I SAM-dependent methyltransferase [Candidatus Omnitrophota bacterium]